MSDIVLGGVVFYDHEIPNKINFGGTHEHKIQMMVGGQRKVDAMGANPIVIKWSGRMRGAASVQRAQTLDAMRIAGAEIPLTWLGLFYTVLITKFEAETEKAFEVTYSIECVVVDDPTQQSGTSPASLDSLVGGDLTTSGYILASAPTNVASGLLRLGNAISAVGQLQCAAVSALAPTLTAALALTATINSTIAANDPALDTVSPDAADPTAMAVWLTNSAGAAVAQSILSDGGPYVDRIATNVTLGGS
jgi:hypothetical protein